jgi:hypothetical protein
MAFISAKRHHTASGTLQNGSLSEGWTNWWKCWIPRQSKEPCFAYAEGPRGQTSIDAFEFAAGCGFSAKLPALPVGDAGKVRTGGPLFLCRGGDRSELEWHGS